VGTFDGESAPLARALRQQTMEKAFRADPIRMGIFSRSFSPPDYVMRNENPITVLFLVLLLCLSASSEQANDGVNVKAHKTHLAFM